MEDTELIFGTYENLILGYKIACNLDGSYGLETSFTDDSHRGALRCLSVSPSGMLASSSTDDSIRLHSLSKRKEIGGLFEHSGTVNCIAFYKGSHMFSASEDGTICMWKCKNWEMLRTLKGHKSRVMAVAVHPSGKLGLSVGSDKSFLTWDLVTGKLAFQRKIKDVAQNILFSSTGGHYILVYQREIEACTLEDTNIVHTVPTSWRINAVCFVQDNVLAVGGDDPEIFLVDILTGQRLITLDMARPGDGSFHSRVRCICVLNCEDTPLLMVALASGDTKVFRINVAERTAEMLLFYETRIRVTCMAVYRPIGGSQRKELQVQSKKSRQTEETVQVKPQKKSVAERAGEHKQESEDADDNSDEQDDGAGSDDSEDEKEQHVGKHKGKKRKMPQKSQGQQKRKKRNDDNDSVDNEVDNGGAVHQDHKKVKKIADESNRPRGMTQKSSKQRKRKKQKQQKMKAGTESSRQAAPGKVKRKKM